MTFLAGTLMLQAHVFLNINGYFDALLEFLDKSLEEGFVKDQHI
jgi:predicted Rossmann-fold nucleotide-binding protein